MPRSNAYQTGAAGCAAGMYAHKAHLNHSGAEMKLTDINRPYVPAAKTDVLRTLMRTGWEPPSLDPRFQAKWKMYRSIAVRNEEKLK